MRPVEQLAVWRIQLLRQASNFCADSRELMSCKIRDSKQEQHGVSQLIHAWSLDRVAGLDHCTYLPHTFEHISYILPSFKYQIFFAIENHCC